MFGAVAGGRGCQNCQKESEEGALSSAQIPLTAALVARQKMAALGAEVGSLQAMGIHGLEGMEEEKVGRYLRSICIGVLRRYVVYFCFSFLVFSFVYSWLTNDQGSGMDIEVPDDQSFFEITVHHRAARFDDRESDAAYAPLERATQAKPGGYMYRGGAPPGRRRRYQHGSCPCDFIRWFNFSSNMRFPEYRIWNSRFRRLSLHRDCLFSNSLLLLFLPPVWLSQSSIRHSNGATRVEKSKYP